MVITSAVGGIRSIKPALSQRVTADSRLAERIQANPVLAARLRPLIPAGMTLLDAAIGFATEAQFIAALYVSRNLEIPFPTLKAAATSAEHETLGKAVRALRPDERYAVRAAERQALADIVAAQVVQPD
jgi:hypothetical protein